MAKTQFGSFEFRILNLFRISIFDFGFLIFPLPSANGKLAWMEPFHQCLALGPVAIYLLLLGVINLVRRPLVVSGGRDAAALGLAVSGLVFVGPMALLFPEGRGGPFRAGGHQVSVADVHRPAGDLPGLVLLTLRPRLVIYNISVDQLRPILAEVVERMDPEARWAGDCLYLPGLGVQLHIESFGWMRNVSLVSAGPKQDYQGWSRLEAELAAALRGTRCRGTSRGLTLLGVGNVLVLGLAWAIVHDPQAIARTVFEMLDMK